MCLPASFSLFGMLFHNSILFLPRRALGWLRPRIGQGGWYSWNHPKSPGSFPCLCCNMASLCLHGMSLKPMARISPGLFLGSGNVLGASATFPWQITLMATQTTLDSSLAFNPGPLPIRFTTCTLRHLPLPSAGQVKSSGFLPLHTQEPKEILGS